MTVTSSSINSSFSTNSLPSFLPKVINTNSIENDVPVEDILENLKDATIEEIISGKWDASFEMALKCAKSDRQIAKDLAYALFSGSKHQPYQNITYLLSYLYLDDQSSSLDFCAVIQKGFEKLKHIKANSSEPNGKYQNWPGKVFGNESIGYGENDKVLVLHGGGKRHIQAYVDQKKHAGYFCNGSIKGIILSPISKQSMKEIISEDVAGKVNDILLRKLVFESRAPEYANSTPLLHCDEPHVIAALVPKKYLYSVNNNAYEVVLKKEHASELEIIFSKTLKNPTVSLIPMIKESILEQEFGEDIELLSRLKECIGRMIEKTMNVRLGIH